MRRLLVLTASLLLASHLAGCVVIPVGDLLRGPLLEEQVLVEGEGLFSRDKIAVIEVDGVITGDDSTGLLTAAENTVSEVKVRLQRVRNDPQVQAVVLRISSPGGEVTACDTIYHELKRFKETSRVPLVAVILDQGASGGYYVACAADHVIAQPTSVVGSIGVLLQTFNLAGLLEKVGVETLAIKSAEKKDLLSPLRARTPEERALLQKVVDDLFARFVAVVAGRPGGPGPEGARQVADGRIFSGTEAEKLKLVDRVAYLPEAFEEAARRANLDRKPTIVRYARPARSGATIYTLSGGSPAVGPGEPRGGLELRLGLDLLPRSRFLYLWQP